MAKSKSAKQPAATETSESIQAQVEAFLKKGGEIEQVDMGVSGQQNLGGPRHISLGNSNPQKR